MSELIAVLTGIKRGVDSSHWYVGRSVLRIQVKTWGMTERIWASGLKDARTAPPLTVPLLRVTSSHPPHWWPG